VVWGRLCHERLAPKISHAEAAQLTPVKLVLSRSRCAGQPYRRFWARTAWAINIFRKTWPDKCTHSPRWTELCADDARVSVQPNKFVNMINGFRRHGESILRDEARSTTTATKEYLCEQKSNHRLRQSQRSSSIMNTADPSGCSRPRFKAACCSASQPDP